MLKERKSLSSFKEYTGKLSREDVATLIETFEFAMQEVSVESIIGVLKNSDSLFAFLVDKSVEGNFDFYKFLNDNYSGNATISPVNAKLMFSRALSRGIFSEPEDIDEPEVQDDEDESETGYLDDEENVVVINMHLYYPAKGDRIEIPDRGLSIGRSKKSADYVIEGNNNISRPHATIYTRGSHVFIHDEDSRNGTFVNKDRVYPSDDVELSVGDRVVLADEIFEVRSN